jgi:hypothetical protein
MNPRALIAQVAREYLGTRETSPNRGPHLAEFWKATGYPDGAQDRQPWCSAFVAFCVAEADRRSSALRFPKPPAFSAVRDWLPWARRPENGCCIFTPADVWADRYHPETGDIVSFLPHLSHIGIVRRDYAGRGTVALIEGNTNDAGSREGDGVYAKERALDFSGHFIRLPARAIPV